MENKTHRLPVLIEPSVAAQLAEVARRQGVTKAEVARRLIQKEIKRVLK